MAWIESHQALSRHRKTLRAVAVLRVDRHKLLGHLHELWWWGLDNVGADGKLGDTPIETIAAAAGWPVSRAQFFVDGMVDAGFLDRTDDGLALHDWWDYAGKLIAQRATNRKRMSDARAAHVQRTDGARAPATQPTVPNQPNQPDHEAALPPSAERFYRSDKINDQIACLVDIAKAQGQTVDGGRMAAMLKRGSKTDVLKALHAALAANAAVLEDYMEGVLRNGKQAGPGHAGSRSTVATADDLARARTR